MSFTSQMPFAGDHHSSSGGGSCAGLDAGLGLDTGSDAAIASENIKISGTGIILGGIIKISIIGACFGFSLPY